MRYQGWLRSVLAAALVIGASGLHAQATRTWVSGVGDDANPCSRTAPCKTFAGAISKTASGGVIDALDPGGFGAVTITKPITLEGNGTLASILSSGTNGVVINITTGTNRDVVLRNILIDGSGTTLGLNGIRFLAGDSLTVENCSLEQFSGQGIDFQPNSLARLVVRNSTFYQAGGSGIQVQPAVGGIARVSVHDSTLAKNATGIKINDVNGGCNVSVVRSSVANNTLDGVFANSTSASSVVAMVEECEITHNSGVGLRTSGANATLRVANSLISGNGTGVSAPTGQLNTYGNNRLFANTSNGAFVGAVIGNN